MTCELVAQALFCIRLSFSNGSSELYCRRDALFRMKRTAVCVDCCVGMVLAYVRSVVCIDINKNRLIKQRCLHRMLLALDAVSHSPCSNVHPSFASRSSSIELRIADRASASNQTRSTLQRIRRIMYALQQENWVPSYAPDLSVDMVLELFWSFPKPPTSKEIENMQLDGWAEQPNRKSTATVPPQSPTSPSGNAMLAHDSMFLTFLGDLAEEEFFVFFYRRRFRSITIAVCAAAVIVVDSFRLYRTFDPSTDSAPEALYRGHSYDYIVAYTCALVALSSMLCLAAATKWLSRRVQLHDAGITTMPRADLRQNARWQEAVIGAATLTVTAFVGVHIVAEQACPFVESIDGQLAFCRNSLGNVTAVFVVACALPCLGFPVRFVILTKLYPCMLAIFLAMNVFLHDARSDALPIQGRRWSWFEIVACRMVFVISVCGWFLIHQWRHESEDRIEFNDACRLEAISLDLKSLRQSLALKVRAIVPSFVARKILAGEKVLDQNPQGIVMAFGIVNINTLYSTLSCAEIVTLLNRVFSSLDHVVSKVPCVVKMQTFGDLYVCVSGVAASSTRSVTYPQVRQAAGDSAAVFCHPVRRLATTMQVTTSGFAPVAIALHVGPVAGVVLGKRLSYVAVGDGVVDCINLMRGATKQSILCSPSFESAQLRGVKWAHQKELFVDSGQEAGLSSSLDDDETALLHGMWCSVRRASGSSQVEAESPPPPMSHQRDYSMERRCLVVNQFKDPEIEADYSATLDGDVTYSTLQETIGMQAGDRDKPRNTPLHQVVAAAHRNVYVGALFVATLNLVMFGLMDAKFYFVDGGQEDPSSSNTEAVALWAGGALMALACIAIENLGVLEHAFGSSTVRLYVRRSFMILILLFNHVAYYRLDSRSFLLHNVEPQIFLLLVVSLGRRQGSAGLFRSLGEDTVLVVTPMLYIQLRLVYASDTSSSTADWIANQSTTANVSSTGEAARLKVSEADVTAITLQFLYVIGLVFIFSSFISRFLSDVDMRHYFGTRSSLADESLRLQEQQQSLRSFVDAAFPQFVAEKFQDYVSRHIESVSDRCNLTDDVDPWLGSWFAMGVVDSPMAVIDFSKPNARVELSQVITQLEDSHQIMSDVLQRTEFVQSICVSKTIGDLSVLVGAEKVSEPINALRLLQCAVAMHSAFTSSPTILRVVLNSGLTTGAVIGTDRVTFEMYGEVIAASTQILDAMPTTVLRGRGVVATDRFVRLLPMMSRQSGSECYSPRFLPIVAAPSLWRIRGDRGAVLVHWVEM